MGRKTEAEALETKRRILIAALDVFFEKGFARSTLDDIADTAGMSRGAIYHHYENKQELLYTLHQDLHISPIVTIIGRIKVAPVLSLDTLEHACLDTFHHLRMNRLPFLALNVFNLKCEYAADLAPLIEEKDREVKESLAYLSRLFKDAQAQTLIYTDATPRVIAMAFYCFIEGLTLCFLKNPETISESYIAKSVAFFLQSLKIN